MISLPTKYVCLVNNDDMIRVIAISDIIVFFETIELRRLGNLGNLGNLVNAYPP